MRLQSLLFFSKKAMINKTRAPKLTKKKLNLLNNPGIVTATPFCHKSDMLNCQCLI